VTPVAKICCKRLNLLIVPLESEFRDELSDLPGDLAARTLLQVFVREYEGAPDLFSLRLRAGFLEKSLAEIDLILQQHRKPWPDHATLSVSLRQAPGPAAPVVQNAFKLLAAAGPAAYCRKKTVQLHEVAVLVAFVHRQGLACSRIVDRP
jgi:hypothetical protein